MKSPIKNGKPIGIGVYMNNTIFYFRNIIEARKVYPTADISFKIATPEEVAQNIFKSINSSLIKYIEETLGTSDKNEMKKIFEMTDFQREIYYATK